MTTEQIYKLLVEASKEDTNVHRINEIQILLRNESSRPKITLILDTLYNDV